MRAIAILTAAIVFAGAAGAAGAGETWRGAAHAKDGDSWFFVVPSATRPGRTVHREIRAAGIDAPELSQPCERAPGSGGSRAGAGSAVWFPGWEAGSWLARFLHGKTVTCTATGARTYGRAVANCTVGGSAASSERPARGDTRAGGKDLEEIIVRAGWAFDYPRYSGGKYAAAEAEAKAARRGIHAGHCEAPWTWRRKHY